MKDSRLMPLTQGMKKALKEARTASGASREKLAKLTGLSPNTFYLVESGPARSVRRETWAKLCAAFKTLGHSLPGDEAASAPVSQKATSKRLVSIKNSLSVSWKAFADTLGLPHATLQKVAYVKDHSVSAEMLGRINAALDKLDGQAAKLVTEGHLAPAPKIQRKARARVVQQAPALTGLTHFDLDMREFQLIQRLRAALPPEAQKTVLNGRSHA